MPRHEKPRKKRHYEPQERHLRRDEKPHTKMTRTATQARAEAVIEKKRRSQEEVVRADDDAGGLGTFDDYREEGGELEAGREPEASVELTDEPLTEGRH